MAGDVEDGLVKSLAVGTDLLDTDVVLCAPESKGAIMAWREGEGLGWGEGEGLGWGEGEGEVRVKSGMCEH